MTILNKNAIALEWIAQITKDFARVKKWVGGQCLRDITQ